MTEEQIAKCQTQTEGYLSYMARAERYERLGMKQVFCRHCKRYKWPIDRCDFFETGIDRELREATE